MELEGDRLSCHSEATVTKEGAAGIEIALKESNPAAFGAGILLGKLG